MHAKPAQKAQSTTIQPTNAKPPNAIIFMFDIAILTP